MPSGYTHCGRCTAIINFGKNDLKFRCISCGRTICEGCATYLGGTDYKCRDCYRTDAAAEFRRQSEEYSKCPVCGDTVSHVEVSWGEREIGGPIDGTWFNCQGHYECATCGHSVHSKCRTLLGKCRKCGSSLRRSAVPFAGDASRGAHVSRSCGEPTVPWTFRC